MITAEASSELSNTLLRRLKTVPNAKTNPAVSTPLAQATYLQWLLIKAVGKKKVSVYELTTASKGWCDLEELKRDIKMKPKPKPVDVSVPAKRKPGSSRSDSPAPPEPSVTPVSHSDSGKA